MIENSWCESLLAPRIVMTKNMPTAWARLEDLQEVIRAVCFIWVAKLGVLAGGDHLLVVAACWLLGSYSLGRVVLNGSPFYASRLLRLALVSFILFAPYFPDTLWAFWTETSFFVAIGLTFLAWIFVAVLCISLRTPLAFLRGRTAVVLYCLFLPILELSILFIFPLAHFGALPSPVPVARPIGASAAKTAGQNSEVWVAIDPHWGESARQKAALEAEASDFTSPRWKFLPSRWPDWAKEVWNQGGRVTIFFPETVFSFASGPLRSLYDHIESAFPETETQLQSVSLPELVLVAGVGSSLENRIVSVRRHRISGRVYISSIGLKDHFVPFFEQETLGYSVYERGTAGEALRTGLRQGEGDWFDLAADEVSWADKYRAAVSICYEGMFVRLGRSGGLRIVFTNTHLFSNFKIAALTYTHTLRLAARLRREAVLLVSNYGDSGLFGDADMVGRLSVPSVYFLESPRPEH